MAKRANETRSRGNDGRAAALSASVLGALKIGSQEAGRLVFETRPRQQNGKAAAAGLEGQQPGYDTQDADAPGLHQSATSPEIREPEPRSAASASAAVKLAPDASLESVPDVRGSGFMNFHLAGPGAHVRGCSIIRPRSALRPRPRMPAI